MAKVERLNKSSSFWLNSDSFNMEGGTSGITKKLKLLAYKRAISNFVKILTQKDGYEIKFSTGNQSYTDGKTVVISSKLDEKNFDLTVGLALHEASHLLLTDFNVIKNKKDTYDNVTKQHGVLGLEMRYDVLHSIFNIVEDRYIDNFVYSTAPGYRGYYQTLYDFYFRSPAITKLLKSPKKRTETVDNYISQLLNIIGLEFDENCLLGMPDIVKEFDLSNITRLVTTMDRLQVAANIYAIILKNVNAAINAGVVDDEDSKKPSTPKAPSVSNESSNDKTPKSDDKDDMDSDDEDKELEDEIKEDDKESEEEIKEDDKESEEEIEEDDKESEEEIEDPETDEEKTHNDDKNEDNVIQPSMISNEPPLTKEEEDAAEALLDVAKSVVDGKVDKGKPAAKNLNDQIDMLDKSDANLHRTEYDIYSGARKIKTASMNTLMVKNLTKEAALNGLFSHLLSRFKRRGLEEEVQKGIILGNLLAKRMQIRNEEKSTITNRLNRGKIFNRHIAMLGADVENIFYKIKTDKFKTSVIHISIDASGSMSGTRFHNCIMTSTAIAKACTYLRGVNCIISFRSVNDGLPMMAVGYNSKKDHFSKIIDLFPHLDANSSTPEGLCYDVYKKFISEEDGNNVDKYVINLSDGEPCFGNDYQHETACNHTKKVWNEILKTGVVGLSYFISEYEHNMDTFRYMYGKNAKSIDTNNIVQLASTINEMLMSNSAVMSILSE
jgi:hypothetical protein